MKTNFLNFKTEKEILKQKFHFVAGCDEVGVAPLAGPVVAAACIIDPQYFGGRATKNKWHARIRDSKLVKEEEREALDIIIREHCLAFGIGEAAPSVIDEINIHHASLLAMKLAVENMIQGLTGSSSGRRLHLLIDGRFIINRDFEAENCFVEQRALVDGDALVLSIAAASIIAKVHRDGLMKQFHQKFPEYNFAKHKGYPTREHYAAIRKHGVTDIHRKSFLKKMEAGNIKMVSPGEVA